MSSSIKTNPKQCFMVNNEDGTVSFKDVTVYDNVENSFFGARDANSFRPDMQSNRQQFWLRDVVSATSFANVSGDGVANYNTASRIIGVRPAFSIYQS